MHPAFLCAHWDGNHIWIQWPSGVESVQWRVRKNGSSDWEEWKTIDKSDLERFWRVIPTWKEGYEVQAATLTGSTWTLAEPCRFNLSSAMFSLKNKTTSPFVVPSGSLFHSVVDGAACTYTNSREITIPAGEVVHARLTTLHASGYSQLDHPGHFQCESEEVLVRNIEPSDDDLYLLPGTSAIIETRPMAAITLAIAH